MSAELDTIRLHFGLLSLEDVRKSIQELWRHHVTPHHIDQICFLLDIDEHQAFDQEQFSGLLGMTERFMFYHEKQFGYGLPPDLPG